MSTGEWHYIEPTDGRPLRPQALEVLGDLVARHSFLAEEENVGSMACSFFRLSNDSFLITIKQERGLPEIDVSLKRPQKTWPLESIRGYLESLETDYRFRSFEELLNWLKANFERVVDPEIYSASKLGAWKHKVRHREKLAIRRGKYAEKRAARIAVAKSPIHPDVAKVTGVITATNTNKDPRIDYHERLEDKHR